MEPKDLNAILRDKSWARQGSHDPPWDGGPAPVEVCYVADTSTFVDPVPCPLRLVDLIGVNFSHPSRSKMKKPSTRTELRIVDQMRTMHLRGYSLACEGARMRLEIAQVHNDGPEVWRVQAKVRSTVQGEDTLANELGPTRTEALRAVAHKWRETEPQHGMNMFDWDAVEALLVSVQAL